MHLGDDSVRAWITSAPVELVDISISNLIAEHIDNLSWNRAGTRLDWELLGGVRVCLDDDSGFEGTQIDSCSHVVCFDTRDQPALAMERRYGLANLDVAYRGAPGNRYVIGANLDVCGQPVLVLGAIVEYVGTEYVMATT